MKNRSVKFLLVLTLFLPTIILAQYPQIKWYYDVNDASFGNAACADLDGDDTLEIVFSCYRNDEKLHVLNAEDGSVHWIYNTNGCNDVAPLIYDVDNDNQLEVILPSSCNPTTFCFDGLTGIVEWSLPTRGSDSPPTIADIDNDGFPEILHGEFGGYVLCINAETGTQAWEIPVDMNSWIQTAPVIVDLDQDNQLDFVVANWNFDTAHTVFAYRGDNHTLLWKNYKPDDYMYHGASVADIDKDGKPELVIGCYDGIVYVLNGEDGSLHWQYGFGTSYYVGAPTSIADFNNDNEYEILFFDYYKVGMLSNAGNLLWDYSIPSYGYSFRGAAISDINGDDTLDLVFGTSKGQLIALNGSRGNVIWNLDLEAHYGDTFEIDHGPIIADFDLDGKLDVFVVGGHAEYPDVWKNYGRAYAISAGIGTGPAWPMFRHDIRRTGCVPIDSVSAVGNIREDIMEVTIQPHPVTPRTVMEIKNRGGEKAVLTIFSITGELIESMQSETNRFYLGKIGLPAGVYVYKIVKGKGNIAYGKLIVK